MEAWPNLWRVSYDQTCEELGMTKRQKGASGDGGINILTMSFTSNTEDETDTDTMAQPLKEVYEDEIYKCSKSKR